MHEKVTAIPMAALSGVTDLNGEGDAVGGIIVMRHGENAREVIRLVRERLDQIQPSLPKGVRVVTTYDRSELIDASIDNLKHELLIEIAIVSLVILVFLWHIPSAIVPIVTIPVSVLLAFIPMSLMGISSNIMSLAGIAISIGVLVDGAIVEVENAYRKLQKWEEGGRQGDFHAIRLEALLEVGPSVFFSLLVIAVAFLPVFTLVDQEGRLFTPLARTKNLELNREKLARRGLSVASVQDIILSAIGGENVTTTVEGRARFPVNVRYPRELRDDLDRLGRVLVSTPSGAQIPLSQVAAIRKVEGPSMIRNENGLLAGYVYVDTAESDIGGFVERAKEAARRVTLKPGYSMEWSGQYENMLRVRERLKLVVPVTLFTARLPRDPSDLEVEHRGQGRGGGAGRRACKRPIGRDGRGLKEFQGALLLAPRSPSADRGRPDMMPECRPTYFKLSGAPSLTWRYAMARATSGCSVRWRVARPGRTATSIYWSTSHRDGPCLT